MTTADNPGEPERPEVVDEKIQREVEHQQRTVVQGSTMDFIQQARSATEKERSMTLLEGIKTYPKAIAWSALVSSCIIMEGYDVCLINNFCASRPLPCCWKTNKPLSIDAFPQFNRKYGEQLPNGEWQIPARWQSGLSNVGFRKLRFTLQ